MQTNGEFSRKYVSHYGLRVRNLTGMIEWYQKFLDARIEYDMGFGAFMTFDDEHHRLVIFTTDDTVEGSVLTRAMGWLAVPSRRQVSKLALDRPRNRQAPSLQGYRMQEAQGE